MENNGPHSAGVPRDPSPGQPSGVGGWLTLLIVILTVLHPLTNILLLAAECHKAEQMNPALSGMTAFVTYKCFSWVLILFCGAISIMAGYRLWHAFVWKTVRQAIVVLWVIGPVAAVLVSLNVLLNFGFHGVGMVLDFSMRLVYALIFSGIWTAYLLRSKRVRNTYIRTPSPVVIHH